MRQITPGTLMNIGVQYSKPFISLVQVCSAKGCHNSIAWLSKHHRTFLPRETNANQSIAFNLRGTCAKLSNFANEIITSGMPKELIHKISTILEVHDISVMALYFPLKIRKWSQCMRDKSRHEVSVPNRSRPHTSWCVKRKSTEMSWHSSTQPRVGCISLRPPLLGSGARGKPECAEPKGIACHTTGKTRVRFASQCPWVRTCIANMEVRIISWYFHCQNNGIQKEFSAKWQILLDDTSLPPPYLTYKHVQSNHMHVFETDRTTYVPGALVCTLRAVGCTTCVFMTSQHQHLRYELRCLLHTFNNLQDPFLWLILSAYAKMTGWTTESVAECTKVHAHIHWSILKRLRLKRPSTFPVVSFGSNSFFPFPSPFILLDLESFSNTCFVSQCHFQKRSGVSLFHATALNVSNDHRIKWIFTKNTNRRTRVWRSLLHDFFGLHSHLHSQLSGR